MVNYLLKKSYQRKNFKEIEFDDLWNKDGVFTTMWIYNKPPKILFFKTHIDNLIKSLKAYKIYDCLLYTSPSPRDLSTSRMPSSA